jgi:G3E family GTPase
VKLLVISGFLGAGKTTLLLRLARQLVDSGAGKIAIIENEIGKTGVDDQFIADQGLDVREIFGGCVCCSLGVSLLTTLKALENEHGADVVMVEPSGVAAPDMVRQLLAGYDGNIESIRILVLFDIERFKALSHVARPYIESSIDAADVVVVNKVDLAADGEVADLVDQVHQRRPGVRIVALSAKSGANFDKLTAALADQPQPACDCGHDHHHDHDHDHHHGGNPIAEARTAELTFDPPMDGPVLADRLSDGLASLTRAIADQPGAIVGHIKCSVQVDGKLLLLRSTSADREPDRDGTLPATVKKATLTLNAIAYEMEPDTLARLVDGAGLK